MSTAFERLQKVAQEKKDKAKLELVPSSDTQKENIDALKSENVVHSKNIVFDTQNDLNLDTQKVSVDALKNDTDLHSKQNNFDTQNKKSLHPKDKSLSVNAPKDKKTKAESSANTLKENNSLHSKYKEYDANRSTVRKNIHIDKLLDQKVHEAINSVYPPMSIKDFYESAALMMLETFDTQKVSSLSANAPVMIDDLKIPYKTERRIINLYLQYNFNFNEIAEKEGRKWSPKWTANDDQIGRTFNGEDIRLIEYGIIETQFNKGFQNQKIFTFKYYAEQIEQALTFAISDKLIDELLKSRRATWQGKTGREIDYTLIEN